ncbi:MAG: phosphotransferase [Lachnospiraceae bacterium]|nr:phosphotransferase [Lachnospiraceae bacterium]
MELVQNFWEKYDITVQKIELLRHNENMTYRVTAVEGEYVLRIHKPVDTMNLSLLSGSMKAEELISGEMNLLEYLDKQSELGTQAPVKNKAGSLVTKVGEYQGTLIRWISGECLVKELVTVACAEQIGRMLAKIHNALDRYKGLSRYSYRQDLVERMISFYHDTLKHSTIEAEQLEIIGQMLEKIKAMLDENNDDMIVVHNDLGESNLLVSEENIVPIDFSLSGICVREMDLASLYCHFESSKIREAILTGYQGVALHKVCEQRIDICIGYQVLIFIFSQFQAIQSQGWFKEALGYWCEEILGKILQGQKIQSEIGLYS